MKADNTSLLVNSVILSAREFLAQNSTSYVRHYRIADSVLRVTAGSAFLLESYLSSFNHVVCTSQNHDFDILLLDSESYGVPYPYSETVKNKKTRFGVSRAVSDQNVMSTIEDDNTFFAADLQRKTAVCWLRGQSAVQNSLPARPFCNPIHWWMTPRKYQLIHAGAIGDERGAVLLLGPKRSGKSTACLNLLAAGMQCLGDDHVIVGPSTSKSGLSVFSLYSRARIRGLPPILAQRQEFVDLCRIYDRKLDVPLYPYFNKQIIQELPLKGIICPYFGQQSGLPVAVSKSYALTRALPTLQHLTGMEKQTMANISDYICELPCYSLEMADDFEQTARSIKQLLEC